MLERWLNGLTEDLMKVNRLAGLLQFELSAAMPYDKIVHASIHSIQEERLTPYRPLSDYLVTGVTGVAEGYQQLLRRIETLKSGFEGIIAIIRTASTCWLKDRISRYCRAWIGPPKARPSSNIRSKACRSSSSRTTSAA
jgi:hypothetical protein